MNPFVGHGGLSFGLESHSRPEIAEMPGSSAFIALLEAFRATGGVAPAHVLECLLGERTVSGVMSLPALIFAGEIFGFPWRGRLWMPMFQFAPDDLTVRPGPRRVRQMLPSSWTEWALASWFAAPNHLLDDQRPADVLESNLVATMGAARSAGAVEPLARVRLQSAPRLVVHGAARESRA